MAGLASVARHEAGHVVAAWRMGAMVEGVVAAETAGYAIIRGPISLPHREFLRRRLLILYSGPEAQRQHDPATDTAASGVSDYAEAADLLAIMHGPGSPLVAMMMRLAEQRAREFVRRERLAIEAIATALCLNGHLDTSTIAAVIGAADFTSLLAAGT